MKFRNILKDLLKNPSAILGLILLFGFTIIAIAAPIIAPVPEDSNDPQIIPRYGFSATPELPSEEHIFGTGQYQYDIFYGVVWGTRTAFRIGLGITIFTTLIGIIVGSVSAYYGGWVDEILMRITEIFQAVPYLLTAIILTSVMQFAYERVEGGMILTGIKLLSVFTYGNNYFDPVDPTQLSFLFGMIAISMFGWMTVARVTRGNILTVKNQEYAMAARTIGAKNSRILFRHLVPNAIFPLIVIATMNIGSFVLTYAALSFLGIGAPEGYADWGQMLSQARNWIPLLGDYPNIFVYPGAAILLFVLAWNLVGDAMRDILDPRMSKNSKVQM